MASSCNFTNQKEWDKARARELYGDFADEEARKKLLTGAQRILRNLQTSIEEYVSIPGLLEYISKRSNLLKEIEFYHLKRSDFSLRQKSLLLVNYIASCQKVPVERFYLCLLDSCKEPGMEGHYIVAQQLKSFALKESMQKTTIKDVEDLAMRIENVSLKSSVIGTMLKWLGMSRTKDGQQLVDLHSIFRQWISSYSDISLEQLVRALLCTPGLGHLVTGIHSIGESNPPAVWRFIESIADKWFCLAQFMGYKEACMKEIKSLCSDSVSDQINLFMRVWRVPNCGDEMGPILDELRKAVEETPPVDQENVNEWSQKDDIRVKCLHQKADVDRGLLKACLNKDWELADLLVNHEALECTDENGCTPLLLSCKSQKIELVMNLTHVGANVRAADKEGNMCLHFSEVLNNRAILMTLLDTFQSRGINIDQRNRSGMTPLLVACLMGDCCADSILALLEAGADPDGNEQAHFRPLTAASSGGHMRTVKLLLDKGANIDIQDMEGRTPLFCACQGLHFEIAKFLIENKADVVKSDMTQRTPLYACVDRNECRMAEVLLSNGATPNTIRFLDSDRGNVGGERVEESPLARACAKGYLTMVKLLCNHGANINEMLSGTVPPVGFSIIHRQHHVVDYLAKHPKFVRTLRGLGPAIIVATKCEDWQCVLYLIETCLQCKPAEALYKAAQEGQHQLQECIQSYLDRNTTQSDEETLHLVMQGEISEKVAKEEAILSAFNPEPYLNRLCQIIVNILRTKPNIRMEALIESTKVSGQKDVSDVLQKCYTFAMDPLELQIEFLLGESSTLRFVTQNNLISMKDFFACVRAFFPENEQEFCNNLVLALHAVSGGGELPASTEDCLKKLLMGGFVPAISRKSVVGGIAIDQNAIIADERVLSRMEPEGTHSESEGASLPDSKNEPEEQEVKLHCLLAELTEVVDWFCFGILLEVDKTQLEEIQRNFPQDNRRCKIEMLSYWLKCCPEPTWEKVAQTASEAKEERIAQTIRQKYCKSIPKSPSASPYAAKGKVKQDSKKPAKQEPQPPKHDQYKTQGSDQGQAKHGVATMEIKEDIPPYDPDCKRTSHTTDSNGSVYHMSRSLSTPPSTSPPAEYKATHHILPAKKSYAFHRQRIEDVEDLERIIKYLREDCLKAMQKGTCEVEAGISLEP